MPTHASESWSCPECGAETPVGEGLSRWCDKCNWNVEPYTRDEESFLARQYAQIGRRRGARILQKLVAAPVDALKPRLTASKVTALCVAIAVHGSSLVVFGLGLLLIVNYFPHVLAVALGIALCGLAWFLLPSFGKLPDDVLPQSEFTALYTLVNDVARELSGQPINNIVVDETFNAGYATVGWRRIPVLWLGLPFWMSLRPQERVALLGHEIAHGVNGDSTRGGVIGTALHTLDTWIALLRANAFPSTEASDVFSRAATWALSLPIAALQTFLAHLLWYDKQKAEFLADYLGATVAGTPATIGALTKTSLSGHFDDFLLRRIYSSTQSGQQVLEQFREKIAELPEREMERVRRAAKLEGARLDSTHPPTVHRMAFLLAHEVSKPRLVADDATVRSIDLELQRLEERLGDRLIAKFANE